MALFQSETDVKGAFVRVCGLYSIMSHSYKYIIVPL